jgi:hypothetical protein
MIEYIEVAVVSLERIQWSTGLGAFGECSMRKLFRPSPANALIIYLKFTTQ